MDDFLSKVLWVRNFLDAQGIPVESQVYQGNESTILMSKKDREVLSKKKRAMNVRYFAIRENIDKGCLKVLHLVTNEMLGDFFTKPLQGKKFRDFRNSILGIQEAAQATLGPNKALWGL